MTDDLDHIEGIDNIEDGLPKEDVTADRKPEESAPPIPAVGIDLGTTNSVIAYLDELRRPQTIVNAEGELLTPTAVLFEPMSVVVGREALKAVATEAEFVADCAKREIGSRTYHKAFHGSRYPPEVIHAFVLQQLKAAARRQLGDFQHAVISVPAYFDDVRRKATQDAGYMAGIEVLDIINEPTAAAIAYGFQHGYLNQQGEAVSRQKILVYDLGGGTFDVTVMDIHGNEFTALAIDGDVQLGGRDWDERLMNFVGDEFLRQHSIDPRETVNAAGRLWRECEDAKRTLSARPRATIALDYKGHNLRVDITRQKFEEITCDLLDRTRFTARQVMKAAGLEWADLDRVLLVGGSTRMPMVREMLKELSGKQPDSSVSADEVVAHGAALHAGLILSRAKGETPSFRVKNVNAHSLGVAAIDPKSQVWRTAVLIPRNTTLPFTAQRDFLTQKPDQRSILVQIVEGESSVPNECSQIGKCVVRDLPAELPAQTPVQVKFAYAENGRLTVHVSVAGQEIQHELSRANSLSEEQLKRWRQTIFDAMEGDDAA